MLATNTQATALAIVASKSLARRRQRPSQAKVLSTNRCTLLPSGSGFGGCGWPDRRIWRWYSEYDLDSIVAHFNALDEGADNVALPGTVELVEPVRHFRGKVLQATDDEAEISLTLRGSDSRFMALLELRQALLHTRNPWLKFAFVDKSLGVAVDQAVYAAPQGSHLLIQAGDLFLLGGAVSSLGESASIFIGDALRFLQDSFDSIPNDLLQLIGAHGQIAA